MKQQQRKIAKAKHSCLSFTPHAPRTHLYLLLLLPLSHSVFPSISLIYHHTAIFPEERRSSKANSGNKCGVLNATARSMNERRRKRKYKRWPANGENGEINPMRWFNSLLLLFELFFPCNFRILMWVFLVNVRATLFYSIDGRKRNTHNRSNNGCMKMSSMCCVLVWWGVKDTVHVAQK